MEQLHIGGGMQLSHARKFAVFFNHLDRAPRSSHRFEFLEFFQQHADVHPLIPDQVRGVAQDSIAQRFSFFLGHMCSFSSGSRNHFQFGKGCIEDFQAEISNSRTSFRRRKRCCSIFSSASKSKPYHSGGISFWISSKAASVTFDSTRPSQGSKDSIPRTDSYTRCREYRPLSGASGKFHSHALKQKP